MKSHAFGVDIGGTFLKIGLFTSAGELLEVREIPTRCENGGAYILKDIVDSVEEELSERKLSKLDIEGIGLGVPGPVGADGTVYRCVNLGWDIFNIEQYMSQISGLRTKAANDANVAALGEMWQGGGAGCRNIVMVTLGTGVGGGVIIDGKILAGANGAAGEIGHIPVNDDETECCGCGKKGCLEQYTSAHGCVFTARRYLAAHPDCVTVLKDTKELDSKVIFDAAREGDPAACGITEEVGRLLGKGLASVACTVNPEAFIIGGGMSKAGDILIDLIRKYYRQYAFHASRETEFRLAKLGNNAGIYGAARMVLD